GGSAVERRGECRRAVRRLLGGLVVGLLVLGRLRLGRSVILHLGGRLLVVATGVGHERATAEPEDRSEDEDGSGGPRRRAAGLTGGMPRPAAAAAAVGLAVGFVA